MNESHPCSYCGTQLDQDGNQLHSGLRPWEGQCREYVKAASNVKDRELVELKTKLEAADRRIQFWQDERERNDKCEEMFAISRMFHLSLMFVEVKALIIAAISKECRALTVCGFWLYTIPC